MISGDSECERTGERARKKAFSLLARKGKTVQELRLHLARQEFDPKVIAPLVSELKREGYLDDRKLAEAIAMSAPRKGWGPKRVFQELVKRGVEEKLAREVVELYCPEDDYNTALRRGRERWKALPPNLDEEVKARRVAGHLERRGFTSQTIIKVLEELRDLTSHL